MRSGSHGSSHMLTCWAWHALPEHCSYQPQLALGMFNQSFEHSSLLLQCGHDDSNNNTANWMMTMLFSSQHARYTKGLTLDWRHDDSYQVSRLGIGRGTHDLAEKGMRGANTSKWHCLWQIRQANLSIQSGFGFASYICRHLVAEGCSVYHAHQWGAARWVGRGVSRGLWLWW